MSYGLRRMSWVIVLGVAACTSASPGAADGEGRGATNGSSSDGGSVAADPGPGRGGGADGGSDRVERPTSGALFYASYGNELDTQVLANPSIVGALYQLYWSEVEPAQGMFDWAALDAHIARWKSAGKKVALRVMWSSSGYWPDPAAKTPTPQWVWAAGAKNARHAGSQTEIPLFWDPIYLAHAHAFLDTLAKRYDQNPDVLFVDVTPGAETNPYRFGTIDQLDPAFRSVFLKTVASDGTRYTDAIWWAMLQAFIPAAKAHFPSLRVQVTLNAGAMPGDASRLQAVGNLAVASGLQVGQNGLKGSSYPAGGGANPWTAWSVQAPVFFEMFEATSAAEGTMQEVVDACLRAHCDFLNVYAKDVVRATPGTATYDPASAAALASAAASLGKP